MSRPLVITDCDEVLLHFARPYAQWLGEAHAIDCSFENGLAGAMRHRASGEAIPVERAWDYLEAFFDDEMHRQSPIAGAVGAIGELQRQAEVVVLTNILDRFNAPRRAQLAALGIEVEVYTNQGPKGGAIKAIVDRHRPSRAVFIDDIAHHHASAAEWAPQVARLHLCGEPALAPHVACALKAGHAHARIDTWDEALPWVAAALQE